jgi:hypothetical protein
MKVVFRRENLVAGLEDSFLYAGKAINVTDDVLQNAKRETSRKI